MAHGEKAVVHGMCNFFEHMSLKVTVRGRVAITDADHPDAGKAGPRALNSRTAVRRDIIVSAPEESAHSS